MSTGRSKVDFGGRILIGALMAGAMIPFAAYAQENVERPINSSTLPFLREASSGSKNNMGGQMAGQSTGSGDGTNGKSTVSVAPGALISQANKCRFRDISGRPSEQAINYLYDKGIVGGRRACYFDPKAVVTRGEAVTMVNRANQVDIPTSATPKAFPDTDVKAWSAKQVKGAKNAGIVHGYPDGLFRAEKAVNTVESFKIVTRGFKSESIGQDKADLSGITDVEPKQWYTIYVQAARFENIIDQKATKIYPASEVTREELALMIYRMLLNRLVN